MPSRSQFQGNVPNVPATGTWMGAAPDSLHGEAIFLYNDTVMVRRLGLLRIGSKLDQKFRLIPVNPCQSQEITTFT